MKESELKKEILKFINYFRDGKEMFLYGRCYWFAIILKERFDKQCGATIMYDPVMNHWATYITGAGLFDASGQIDDKGFVIWSTYKMYDKEHIKRLEAQCINYTED